MLFGRTLRTRRAAQDAVLRLYSTSVSVERERVACELLMPGVGRVAHGVTWASEIGISSFVNAYELT